MKNKTIVITLIVLVVLVLGVFAYMRSVSKNVFLFITTSQNCSDGSWQHRANWPGQGCEASG